MVDFVTPIGGDNVNLADEMNPIAPSIPFEIDQQKTGANGVVIKQPYPPLARVVSAGSSGGNQSNAATINAVGGLTFYMTKVTFLTGGATAALAVAATVTGLQGGTRTYGAIFAGTVGIANNYDFNFNPPLPSVPGQNVVATLPAGGSGNTAASVNIEGYYL